MEGSEQLAEVQLAPSLPPEVAVAAPAALVTRQHWRPRSSAHSRHRQGVDDCCQRIAEGNRALPRAVLASAGQGARWRC